MPRGYPADARSCAREHQHRLQCAVVSRRSAHQWLCIKNVREVLSMQRPCGWQLSLAFPHLESRQGKFAPMAYKRPLFAFPGHHAWKVCSDGIQMAITCISPSGKHTGKFQTAPMAYKWPFCRHITQAESMLFCTVSCNRPQHDRGLAAVCRLSCNVDHAPGLVLA